MAAITTHYDGDGLEIGKEARWSQDLKAGEDYEKAAHATAKLIFGKSSYKLTIEVRSLGIKGLGNPHQMDCWAERW